MLAAQVRKLITARARKNKRTARMLANTIRYPYLSEFSSKNRMPIVSTDAKFREISLGFEKRSDEISRGLVEFRSNTVEPPVCDHSKCQAATCSRPGGELKSNSLACSNYRLTPCTNANLTHVITFSGHKNIK